MDPHTVVECKLGPKHIQKTGHILVCNAEDFQSSLEGMNKQLVQIESRNYCMDRMDLDNKDLAVANLQN